jgi:hypothetical protein
MIAKRLGRGVLLLILTAVASHAPAQDVSPLRGEAFIASRTPIDPPPAEPKNSHAYLTISRDGKAATCDFSVDLIKGALDGGRPC